MRLVNVPVRLAALILILITAPQAVLSCICDIRPPACFDYWRDDAVFVGTVQRVFSDGVSVLDKVEVAVSESFKGMAHATAETANFGHSCAHTFRENDKMLFYASTSESKTNEFATGYCMRTARYSETLVDLGFLRAVRDNKPVFWAWGTISKAGYDRPLEGIQAEILGQSRPIVGTSDANGDIKLNVSKPGKYRVRIYLPKGRTDINTLVRNDLKLWEMQRKQIVGGRYRGNRPYVDFEVSVQANRCGWFDVSIPDQIR